MMKADKTGYDMMFHEKELELLHPEQISDHDGNLGFMEALQAKDKRKNQQQISD